MSVIQRELGKCIAQLRKRNDLTQEALAEAVGCSVEFISLIERGINSPSVQRLSIFASALHVEVKDLFDFKSSRDGNKIKRRKA